jgi:hypothetical protein
MNEHDDIAQWFARQEQPTTGDAFVEAVQERVERERRRARAAAIGGSVLAAGAGVLALLALTPEVTHPTEVVQQLLTSRIGIIASAFCALALTVWPRLADE